MANEESFGRSASGIPYPSQFKFTNNPWATQAAGMEEASIRADAEKMTFAQVIDQRNSHLDSIELAKDRDTLVVKAYDLDRFDAGVRASKHGDALDSYVKHEDQSLAARLNVSAAEAQAYRVQATDPNYSADPERIAAFHENRREVYREAMAEMSEQLDARAAAVEMTAARNRNDLDRDGVPDHLEFEPYDGEAERASAAFEQQMRDRAYHSQPTHDFDVGGREWDQTDADITSLRQEIEFSWKEMRSPPDPEGLVARITSVAEAAINDPAYETDARGLARDWGVYQAEWQATIEGISSRRYMQEDLDANPFKHEGLRAEYTAGIESTYDKYVEMAQQKADAQKPQEQSEGRWVVQERDETKGVFVDVLQTASALEAHERMRQGAGHDARVLDQDLKDYAAEWQREHPQALPQIAFHARSSFERDLEVETRAELQRVVDTRSQLQSKVDQATESVSVAVDQVRDPAAPDAAVHRGYETAAIAYAAAKRELEAFEAKPAESPIVVSKFNELQAAETAAESARLAAAHGRIDGVSEDQAKAAHAAHEAAQARLDALVQREGISLPKTPERTGNEIEAGLSPDQIRRLMQQPSSREAEPMADKPSAIAPPAPTPQIGEAHNQVRNQSAFADAAARDRLVPEDVAAAYKRDGQKYLDVNDPKRVAFVDKGNRLQTVRTFDDKAVDDMIRTADARGWTEIKVSGDEAFRRTAWIKGTARGMEVKGYEPTEKDKLRAEQLGRETGHANAIEENKTLQAYRQVRDGSAAEKKAAAQEHPELTKAFALEQASRSFAKQRLRPDDVERFVEANRQMIETKLARGEQIPEVRKREDQERRRDVGIER